VPQNLDFATGRAAVRTEQTFLRDVFTWMFAALALSTGIAVWFHADSTFNQTYLQTHQSLFLVAIFAQLGLVIAISRAINRISARTAAVLFFLYAGLTGAVFSVILTQFTTGTVVGAFAGAAGVFGGMAVWGYTTQRDLSGWGGLLFGALIGIVVASIVFVFVGGSTFNLILGWGGVILFSALTAFQMQGLKRQAQAGFGGNSTVADKAVIIGALGLYLSFVNLFISLLRIFGGGR
jgi:FtsH-binding integral membrane protein